MERILAVTGHRPKGIANSLGINPTKLYEGRHPLVAAYKAKLERILGNTDVLISGMALGVDSWAVEVGLQCNVKIIAAVPTVDHGRNWPQVSQDQLKNMLKAIKGKGGEVVVIEKLKDYKAYTIPAKLNMRNHWMVDNCKVLLALWNGESGGTSNCIQYAKEKGVKVVNIWDSVLKEGITRKGETCPKCDGHGRLIKEIVNETKTVYCES